MSMVQKCEKLIADIENGKPYAMGVYMYAFPRGYDWAYAADRDNCMRSVEKLRNFVVPDWIAFDIAHSVFGHEVSLICGDMQVYACDKTSKSRAMLICILKAMIEQEKANCS